MTSRGARSRHRFPGSGKSTLASQLARRTGLPAIHLDQQYWRAGWVEPPADEWLRKVEQLAGRERWVMDGNYGGRYMKLRSATEVRAFLASFGDGG